MYDHHKVATLDDLIKYIKEKDKEKEKDSNYDSSYQKRLEDFLENKIKNEYGNITVVAASFLVEKYNKRGSNEISEENQRYYENNEFANLFEERLRSKTKSKKYYLISIEYDNGYPILIAGKPDGLGIEGKMNNKAKIFEAKSFNLTTFIQFVKEPKDYILNKKVLNIIKTSSSQLILYQYLLDKTQKFGLIGKNDKINLYGKIYLYSDNIGYLSWARKIIEKNFNTIKRIIRKYAKTYNAYNLSLKDGEIININNKKVYYFEIDFRVEYNPKIVENYLKNLNELIKSLK
jgi:hypothetical protein